MPRYDVKCDDCDTVFEIDRPIAQADDPAPCPSGHTNTSRKISVVAVGGMSSSGASGTESGSGGGCGGGCCGGACAG